ncbi:hypothetical protein B0H17DRAFT_679824 [Mycena rosella]|uniref:Uncharacterized protein n=1 Tax=Mycena rosella TaxID=1033263 RepID=A0AAD7DBD8_MYCRO|nr:hypothetical protein B0H17DRAFT_679824 [Mycena rosella]
MPITALECVRLTLLDLRHLNALEPRNKTGNKAANVSRSPVRGLRWLCCCTTQVFCELGEDDSSRLYEGMRMPSSMSLTTWPQKLQWEGHGSRSSRALASLDPAPSRPTQRGPPRHPCRAPDSTRCCRSVRPVHACRAHRPRAGVHDATMSVRHLDSRVAGMDMASLPARRQDAFPLRSGGTDVAVGGLPSRVSTQQRAPSGSILVASVRTGWAPRVRITVARCRLHRVRMYVGLALEADFAWSLRPGLLLPLVCSSPPAPTTSSTSFHSGTRRWVAPVVAFSRGWCWRARQRYVRRIR